MSVWHSLVNQDTMSKCVLETHPEHGGCCCRCRHRLQALKDSGGSPNFELPDNTWACIAFAFCQGEPITYVGDFEHGMCEMFTPLPWPGKLLWR